MMHNDDERVLVLSALPVDAQFVCAVAGRAGIPAQPCRDMDELCAGIRQGAGTAVVSQRVLCHAAFDELVAVLHEQPAWSDFPLILVAVANAPLRSEQALEVTPNLGNVVVLQRPLRVATMVTALKAALRARRRQYEVRRSQQLLEDALSRERARASELEAIMEAVPMAIFIARDPDCREVAGNRLTYDLLRLPPGSNLSRSPLEGPGAAFRTLKGGREMPLHDSPVRIAAATGQPVRNYEFEVTLDDGTSWLVLGNAVPLIGEEGRPRGAVGAFMDITERKRAEEALRESEARFRALVAASSEVLYRMSPDWSEMLHLRGGGFIADTEAPSRIWLQKYIPADERPRVTAVINEAIRTRSTFELEHKVRRVDGGIGWAFSRAIPRLDANGQIVEWFGAASDITERKQAEEALREGERRWRELADSMPQLVWTADETGAVTYVSRRWSEQIGLPTEQCLGDAWIQVLHPEDVNRTLSYWRRCVETGEHYQIEFRIRVSSLEYRWFLVRAVPIRDGQGRITHWLGTATDIDDLKRAEDRLRQAQKLESVGLLAGGIAHDFNNLLTSIMGNASLVLKDVSDRSAEQVKAIIGNADRAAHLTRQLLAYSGKGQFILRDLDVSQVVSEMGELLQLSIPKSVDLAMHVRSRLPLVRMDPGQLQQILINLVVNAGEAIGEGNPGKIAVATSMTDIEKPFVDPIGEEVAAGRYVSIEVSDTGAGIEERERSRIFDPFFTTKFQGRGLGLAAVAGILRSQKGGIKVESAPGRGSSFQVLLPPAARHPEGTEKRPGGEGRTTVLVVDDEPSVRDFISAVLRQQGYRVLTASDGQDALAVCGRESGEIDGAVLDVVMPRMGADDFLPTIKRRLPKMKVLLTSGYGESEARRLCTAYADAAFIQKPYTAEQLAKAMDELLGTARP
jgi:PAS domain S-box-containing protein